MSRNSSSQSVKCKQLVNLPNVRVKSNGVSVNSIATYQCFVIYDSKRTQATCLESGRWSVSEPVCPPHAPTINIGAVGPSYIFVGLISGLWSTVDGAVLRFTYEIKQCKFSGYAELNITDFKTSDSVTVFVSKGAKGYIDYHVSRARNISGLEENSNYRVSFYNYYMGMESRPSVGLFSTSEAAPTGRPQNFQFTSTPNNVTLNWNPILCKDRNTIIERYNIKYASDLDPHSIDLQVYDVPEGPSTYNLNGLIPRTTYRVTVSGANSASEGPAAEVAAITAFPHKLEFWLKGRYYSNNSIMSYDMIGEKSEALFCLTPFEQCCNNSGSWILPDGSAATSSGLGLSAQRWPNKVGLNHRQGINLTSGVLTCEIPGISNQTRFLYIYAFTTPEQLPRPPVIDSLIVNPEELTLVCISSGPIDQVDWIINTVKLTNDNLPFMQFQKLLNRTTLQFEHKLKGSVKTDFIGKFICRVTDVLLRSAERAIGFNKPCDDLPNIVNGTVQFNGTLTDSVARYECIRGYMRYGNLERRCFDGRWTNNEPVCIFVTTPIAPSVGRGFQRRSYSSWNCCYAFMLTLFLFL